MPEVTTAVEDRDRRRRRRRQLLRNCQFICI
jgi:hypothetical protein